MKKRNKKEKNHSITDFCTKISLSISFPFQLLLYILFSLFATNARKTFSTKMIGKIVTNLGRNWNMEQNFKRGMHFTAILSGDMVSCKLLMS